MKGGFFYLLMISSKHKNNNLRWLSSDINFKLLHTGCPIALGVIYASAGFLPACAGVFLIDCGCCLLQRDSEARALVISLHKSKSLVLNSVILRIFQIIFNSFCTLRKFFSISS